ncbi:hypothetical protein [Effusibacillus consociatus]|uniref:Uncharacterized protein n=1 Tax=Effusibacillus consociatus TaxID=1117041 RepID=A0ABV9PZ77_9BACL
MRFVLVSLWGVVCVLAGDWILRKGIEFQQQGIRRGVWIQILAAIVTIGLPILVAFIVK